MKVSIITVFIFGIMNAKAELKYFNNTINYWGKKEVKIVEEAKNEESHEKSDSTQSKFPWHKYHNPKYKEFWKEGNHTTPDAVAEAARVISSKNSTEFQKKEAVNNYKKWIKLKNKLHTNFAKALMKYSLENSRKLPDMSKEELQLSAKNLDPIPNDREKVRFTMYFRSTCPHCKRMFHTLNQLQELGFYVEAKQVDNLPLKRLQPLIPVLKATKSEISRLDSLGVTGVPFTFAFTEGGKSIPIQGFRTLQQVLQVLNNT